MRPNWCASRRRAWAFSEREGEGEGKVGEGGVCLVFSRASIASETMFFSFLMLPDRLCSVCSHTHTHTHTQSVHHMLFLGPIHYI